MNLLKDQTLSRSLCSITQITVNTSLGIPGVRSIPLRHLGRPRSLKKRLVFGSELRHHCLCCGHGLNATSSIHVNSVPFPERLVLPFANDEILSSFEEFDSRVMMSEHEIVVQHMVDIEKATAKFREASGRNHATDSHMNSSNKRFATRSIVQRTLGFYNWNPGTRRGKEDAFEQQIAGMWHIITLQEASDFVAVLINKDTFYSNVASSSHGRRTGMGLTRYSFTCHISSSVSERAKVLCCVVSTYPATFTRKTKALPRSSSSLFVPL